MPHAMAPGPMELAAHAGASGPQLHEVIDYHALASFSLAAGHIVHSTLLDPLGPQIARRFPGAADAWSHRHEWASYVANAQGVLSELPEAESLIVTVRDAAFRDTELAPTALKQHMHVAKKAVPIVRTMIRNSTEVEHPIVKDAVLGILGPFADLGNVGAEQVATLANGHLQEVRKKFEQAHDRAVLPLAIGLDRLFRETSEFPDLQAELVREVRTLTDAVWGQAERLTDGGKLTSRDIGYALYETVRNLHDHTNWQEWGRQHLPLLSRWGLGKAPIPEFVALPNPKGLTQFALARSGAVHQKSTEDGKIDAATAEIFGVGAYEIMAALEELGTQPGQRMDAGRQKRLDALARHEHPLRRLLQGLPTIGKLREIKAKLDGLVSLPILARSLRDLAPRSKKQAQDTVSALARLTLPATK